MQPVKTPFLKNTRLLIVLGVIAGVVLFVAIVAVLAVSNSKEEAPATTQADTAEDVAPATNDEVKQSMAVLDAAIKQSDADGKAADDALKNEGAVKVGD